MKIVLDLQGAQSESRFRGIGRYSLSLAKAMIRQAKKHELYVAINHAFPETVDKIREEFSELLEPDHILVFQSPKPVAAMESNNYWRARAAELMRERFLQGLAPDIVHISSLFEGYLDDTVTSVGYFCPDLLTAVTLYDLIPYLNQDQYLINPLVRTWYMRKLESLKKSDLLLAISESTRQAALEVLDFPEDRIVNVLADAAPLFRVINATSSEYQAVRQHYGLERDIVMYVGGFDKRKNVEALIAAFAELPPGVRFRHQLLIVGKISESDLKSLKRHCKKAGLMGDQVVFTGYASDENLLALYNLCKLFVFPSLHEGFGLPVLEAMRCGAAVIGSDRSSVPEIISLKEALFDPTSVQSITSKMCQSLTDEEFRQLLCENGRIQAKKFSWETSAKRTLKAFEALHERRQYRRRLRIQAQCPPNTNHTGTASRPRENPDQATDGPFPAELRNLISAVARVAGREFSQADMIQVALAISENEPSSSIRQLFIDITILVRFNAKTGIQRVQNGLLRNLLDYPPKGFRVEPVYRNAGRYWYARRFVSQYRGVDETYILDELAEIGNEDIFLGLDLDLELGNDVDALDFLQHHRRRGMKIYFVLYDLLPILKQECFTRETSRLFKNWLNKIIEVANGIVCISRAVADDLKVWLNQQSSKRPLPLDIGFFHLGADISKNPMTRGITEEGWDLILELNQKMAFLMVGTVEPRKGHSQVLDALESLWIKGEDVLLVIVGKEGWKMKELAKRLRRHPENGKRLFWFENASDELLEKFYEHSSALIMASEAEGFGLPLVEAAKYGLPIIARDLPVFREVAGKYAYYFTSHTGEELADSLSTWLAMYRRDSYPTSKGLQWLSWKQSSQELQAVLLNDNWYEKWK